MNEISNLWPQIINEQAKKLAKKQEEGPSLEELEKWMWQESEKLKEKYPELFQ